MGTVEEINMIENSYFTSGCIVDEHRVALSYVEDHSEIYSPYSEIIIWDSRQSDKQYNIWKINDWIQNIIYFTSKIEDFSGICALSVNGFVYFIKGQKVVTERIRDSENWGVLLGIKQVGEHLYVYGDAGQIYIRTGKDSWEHFDENILSKKNIHDFLEEIKSSGHYMDYLKDYFSKPVEPKIAIHDVGGYSEYNLYAAGSVDTNQGPKGVIFHHDGKEWQRLDIPETGTLGAIFAHRHDQIMVGGKDGHLLVGDFLNGFKDVSGPKDLMIINSMTKVNNSIYLGSSDGLFQFREGKISHPDIKKALKKANPKLIGDDIAVDSYGSDMLIVGTKQVYRVSFETNEWTEIFSLPDAKPEFSDEDE